MLFLALFAIYLLWMMAGALTCFIAFMADEYNIPARKSDKYWIKSFNSMTITIIFIFAPVLIWGTIVIFKEWIKTTRESVTTADKVIKKEAQ